MNKKTINYCVSFVMILFLFLCGCNNNIADLSAKTVNDWENYYINYIDSLKNESVDNLNFGLYDIDKDSVPELFVENTEKMYEVYTLKNNDVVKIGDIFLKPYVTSAADSVFTYGGAGTGVYEGLLYTLNDKKFEERWLFRASYNNDTVRYCYDSEDVEIRIEAEEYISETEYNDFLNKYKVKEVRLYSVADIDFITDNISGFVTQ